MQDAITTIYQRFLPTQELATGRLLSKGIAQDLPVQKILSNYYYKKNGNLSLKEEEAFFMRGFAKNEKEYVYLTGVAEEYDSIFYAATQQSDDKKLKQGNAFDAVYAISRIKDIEPRYKDDRRGLLKEPTYVLNRDNYFPNAVPDIIEPDVFAKLTLTYARCEKYNIPKRVGLQYVIDGIELL